ncbi:hypothetical protein [Mucilaginibacter antarcticus]|uniref:SMODS-associating 2TM beta-strand rich effector domain-containing protein n=1 Tax=Mucilaginibacter antarcticus TaxID=1855725 RepID=A0ABW5XRG9_9SPHI
MKTTYRLFSTNMFLNTIASLFLVIGLGMILLGTSMLLQYGLNYFTVENPLYLPALIVILVFAIWILTSSVLPLIIINANGVTAYSIFWKRTITWKDLQTARLVKVKNYYRPNGSAVNFEDTKIPERKSIAVLNKGTRVTTFIVLSGQSWQKPRNMLILSGLYTHQMIAGENAIVFEYDANSWKTIKNKRDGNLKDSYR